jgi:hypothetical protein
MSDNWHGAAILDEGPTHRESVTPDAVQALSSACISLSRMDWGEETQAAPKSAASAGPEAMP